MAEKRKPDGECCFRPGLICFKDECNTCGWNPKEEKRRHKIEFTEVNGINKKIIKRRTEEC